MLVRRPESSDVTAPLLILLHGLGSDAQDLMGLAPYLDPSLLVVSLQAPHAYAHGGYAWFEVQWTDNGVTVDGRQAQESLALLNETVVQLADGLGVQPRKTIIGGFSQGAMMSFGLTVTARHRLDAALLLSGRLLPEFLPTTTPDLAGLPVLVQHGLFDQVLPVSGSKALAEYLSEAGAEVTFKEYAMAHEINGESLNDARAWLAAHL